MAGGTEPRRALVLAAGRGERLRPLTDERPKCLVPLAGRSLLDWQVAALGAAGLEEVAAVVGYRGDEVHRPGLARLWNRSWRRTNMVASLLSAADWVEGRTCIVSYGDIAYHPDHVERLAAAPGDLAITCDLRWRSLWDERFERPEEDAESLRIADGRVVEIGSPVRDLDSVEAQYMGLSRFTPRGFEIVRRRVARMDPARAASLQMTELLGELAASGVEIAAVPVEGRWCEVDCLGDLALYESRIASGEAWAHDWRF
jgi:L-glutamine-phosphate cytidylyltransferase